MATYNKTLGNFELSGIPTAPRGVPQIEVTFDIDANGIVHVSAKDLGTGKEQSIRITASSGLSKEEVEKMVRDAESHAAEDKKKRELIEAKNQGDNLVYSTEKSLKEFGDKIDASEKQKIEEAIAAVKKALEGSDAEEIKKVCESLNQASHKLAEAVYAKAQPGAEAAGGEPHAQEGEAAGAAKGEKVVDADFEEVKDDKDKK
jgi:molecular chaperone DnaK